MPGKGRIVRCSALALALVVLLGSDAVAVPHVGKFGRGIDPFPGYDGASKCDPDAKPGVVAFQQMVLRAYPGTGAGSISRSCYGGSASSEHNEGRAWDWGVNAGVPSQKKKADELIAWLLAKDKWDNKHAMARRAGIMYIIWNRRIWFPWSGWDVYCEQRKRGCVDPDDGGTRSPHTDHVHFSFTWQGARKQTTLYQRDRSYITVIEPQRSGNGFWMLARNGSVIAKNATYYGSREQNFPKKAYVSMAALPAANGYWMLNANGKVAAEGDARNRGDVSKNKGRPADIEATPTGIGYWIVMAGGRVFAFGNARNFEDARDRDVKIIAMTATPSGRGYWLLTDTGNVLAFGDAPKLGRLDSGVPVDIAATSTGGGYWVLTETGNVRAFGDAESFGDAADELRSPAAGIAPTPTGRGYRIVTKVGSVLEFGDA